MKSLRMKTVIGALGVGAIILASAGAGFATQHNSLSAGTKVTGKLQSGTDMTFVGSIDSVSITVTCTSFSSSGKVPSGSPYTVDLTKPPKITGCTDSLAGVDTITTNATNGKWMLTENNTSPYTMSLVEPKAGATFKSSADPGCVITTAPKKANSIVGAYDTSTGTFTDTNESIPTKGAHCSSTTSKATATIVLTPNPGTPPF